MRDKRPREEATFEKRRRRDPDMYQYSAWVSAAENLDERFGSDEDHSD